MKPCPDVFIYTALPCEAKPLISHLRMKREVQVRPFAVYRNETICLVVTGLGKNAMAAGVAFTQALYAGLESPLLINVGVAGHQTETIGTPFIGHKITDADTGRKFYPVPAYSLPCASEAIVTASRPQLEYDHQSLCDMEASAFYETASRFSTGELVQCLKVVSDNRSEPADCLDAMQVSLLIERNVEVVEDWVFELNRLARQISPVHCEDFDPLIRQYRFTVTEQHQLKYQLLRWKALAGNLPLEFDRSAFKKGKDVLRWLEREIAALDVLL